MMLKYRVFGWLKTKTTVQRNHGVGINKLIRTPIGVARLRSVRRNVMSMNVNCHEHLTFFSIMPASVVVVGLTAETMANELYYYGAASRYSDLECSVVTKIRDIGGRAAIAHFNYPHQGIEWKDKHENVVNSFYKLNNQYVARAWSEREFHYKLQHCWLPNANSFVTETCHGEKELVPLELRYILKWVYEVLDLPTKQWPSVFVLLSGEDGPLTSVVASNDVGQPSKKASHQE